MNIWKRAWLHTKRKKGKTVLMLLILLIISTLILTCISIRSAADTAALNIRKSLMGGFTVNAKHLETLLDDDAVIDILKLSGIGDQYNLRSYGSMEYRNLEGHKLKIKTEDAMPPSTGLEHAGKVVSATHSDWDTYFTEAGFELIQGRHITAGDTNAVIVSEAFAEMNGLKLGEHILLGDLNSDRQAEVEIVGIFRPQKELESSNMMPPAELYENVSFTDDGTYSRLVFEDGGHYQYGDFYVEDPAELDAILERVKSIPDTDWNQCFFTKNNADYLRARTQLESLQNLIAAVVMILIGISAVMLTLILLLWTRARIQEIGMLMAMGVGKVSIVAQHITELLLIAAVAFTLSFAGGALIAQQVCDTVLQRTAAEEHVTENNLTDGTVQEQDTHQPPALETITVRISGLDLLTVIGIGSAIIILSVAAASIPVMRLKPKEILTKMS